MIISNSKRNGFSLIEIMVVIGLIGLLGGLGVFYGIDAFRGQSFHSDRDTLVTALQHARSQAVGNICRSGAWGNCTDGKPYGVKVFSDKLVVFQGPAYATRDVDIDAEIELNPNITHSGTTDEVVFKQLEGGASPFGDIAFTDLTGRISTTSVEATGRIAWTH